MRKLSTKPDRENPEWSSEDFAAARPAVEVLPAELTAVLPVRRGKRGPQVEPTKQLVSLRIDEDVLTRFRATGAGWQTRINEALKQAVGTLS